MSSPSSESTSTSSSNSRKRVTFVDSDIVIPLRQHSTSEAEVSGTQGPLMISSTAPPPHTPTPTASTSFASGSYIPPSNIEGDLLIEGQDDVAIEPGSPAPPLSDAVVLQETKLPDMYESHSATDLIFHQRLTTSYPVHWDMLTDPQLALRPHPLDEFGQDFMTLNAFTDSISKIIISCEILPWPITIDIEKDDLLHSPRIEVILNSIYASLRKLTRSVDLNNQTTERQHRIQKAYQRRCRQLSISPETDGLKRIDFLEGQTLFLGLSPGDHEDEWNLHVGREY